MVATIGRSGVLAAIALLAACVESPAQESHPPLLRPGDVELGVAGSLTVVEGSARTLEALRGGVFLPSPARGTLVAAELELAHSHVGGLDLLDLQGQLGWHPARSDATLRPFVALGGGLRQEWLGSFAQARWPLGGGAGLLALASPRAGVRVEYRFRRILGDPVADYSEHHVLLGLSLLFPRGR